MVLVIVFVNGQLSNLQQAFYRTKAIDSLDDELQFTNLLNVAQGYDQESWVCLVNLGHCLGEMSWEERILTVTEHFWRAAFNRSSEEHEENSFWESLRGLDERLETPEKWQAATRSDPGSTPLSGSLAARAAHTGRNARAHARNSCAVPSHRTGRAVGDPDPGSGGAQVNGDPIFPVVLKDSSFQPPSHPTHYIVAENESFWFARRRSSPPVCRRKACPECNATSRASSCTFHACQRACSSRPWDSFATRTSSGVARRS